MPLQATFGLGVRSPCRIALRRHDQKLAGPFAARSRIFVSSGGPSSVLVRDHQHVPLSALAGHVDDDVLHRPVAGDVGDAVDDVPAQPAGLRLRVRRDDDRVDGWLELGERVAHGGHRVALDHEAVCRDPTLVEHRERALEPSTGRSAPRVLVHDVAALGLIHRADDGHAEVGAPCGARRRRSTRAGHCLVCDDEEVHQCSRTSAIRRGRLQDGVPCARHAVLIRLPTTCGISSKLNTGGGDDTCHSSVSDRHGFAEARGPRRMLMTML